MNVVLSLVCIYRYFESNVSTRYTLSFLMMGRYRFDYCCFIQSTITHPFHISLVIMLLFVLMLLVFVFGLGHIYNLYRLSKVEKGSLERKPINYPRRHFSDGG